MSGRKVTFCRCGLLDLECWSTGKGSSDGMKKKKDIIRPTERRPTDPPVLPIALCYIVPSIKSLAALLTMLIAFTMAALIRTAEATLTTSPDAFDNLFHIDPKAHPTL
ncbi:MAG: hypothetical protein L6R40_001833 [Gallowayella cf. fulva]|nr:MAG: hypothetical protein L6R40_001833 [Xanthomendoza cf. fulva]